MTAIDAITHVEGYLYDAEAQQLYDLARSVRSGCIVEIGSYRGRSTVMLAKGAQEAGTHVYAIDPHFEAVDGIATYGKADRTAFLRNILEAGVSEVVRKIDLPSSVAVAGWQEPIALLWIDGGHDYANAKHDFEHWSPFVMEGGVIAYHDSTLDSVAKVQAEMPAEYTLIAQVFSTRVYKKQGIDVSVLIPAYNANATLAAAVESAVTQEGVRVQVIVTDDGSAEPVREAFKDNPLFKGVLVFSIDQNMGQAAALNAAASVATGRYLIELDADDTLMPGALAALARALDAAPENVGFVYGSVVYDGAIQGVHYPPPYQRERFYSGFPALYPFLYRRDAYAAGCRYAVHAVIDGKAHSIQDWDMALQLIEYIRYDGLALPSVKVLHYHANENGAGAALKANNDVLMAAFRKRWPKVYSQQL